MLGSLAIYPREIEANSSFLVTFLLLPDMGLEAQAKRWAQRCVFKHELIKGRGENLAFSTYQNPEIEMIKSSSKGWFDEKKDYRPGQRGCQMSCHYTQVGKIFWLLLSSRLKILPGSISLAMKAIFSVSIHAACTVIYITIFAHWGIRYVQKLI